jgi:hypothetical protein
MRPLHRLPISLTLQLAVLVVAACSEPGGSGPSDPGAGGTPSGGSGIGSGGVPGSGGSAPASGGQPGGGAPSGASGGQASSGGAAPGGGASAVGGQAPGSGGDSPGTGGGSAAGGAGGSGQGGKVFEECRFHFGAIREYALDHASIRDQIDYFTPGWMGLQNTFDQGYVCDDLKGALAGKVPVVVAYVSAFYAKREQNLHDCNVGQPDLCTYGADIIKNHLETIVGVYSDYARGYAACLGDRPIVFEMEPDFYQYTLSNQTSPLTPQEAGQIMKRYVEAMKEHLPNAYFSMDISPWVPPNNGSDNGADWYSNFDMSMFKLINTSGGGTEANNTKIRSSNNMTWAGVSMVTSKPVLADTGYGVNGASAGHDAVWDVVSNINARINDGVIGITQYNPNADWGSTIASIRSQLAEPKFCL